MKALLQQAREAVERIVGVTVGHLTRSMSFKNLSPQSRSTARRQSNRSRWRGP